MTEQGLKKDILKILNNDIFKVNKILDQKEFKNKDFPSLNVKNIIHNDIINFIKNLPFEINEIPKKELILSTNKDAKDYITAFFEAFPKTPSCFIRGEGKTIEEAEENAWNKYQKILNCNHEMERRDRTDGYAYCKHCSYSSTVFEPLTKCCKCGKPTAFTKDYKGKYYCKKHSRIKPKNPNPSRWEITQHRVPRKYKKLLKKCVTWRFEENGIFGKVTFSYTLSKNFKCNNNQISILFDRQEKNLIKEYKSKL